MAIAAVKPPASLFPRRPNLRQESAVTTAGEQQPRIAGLLAANHISYDGLVQVASIHAPYHEVVDGGAARGGVEGFELVGSGWERSVSNYKLERNFDGKRGVV